MGLSVKGGQITSPTSTGNHATTGVGFQPKLLILYSTLATDATSCSPTMGAGTSSTARWSQSQYYTRTGPATGTLFNSSKIFAWTTSSAFLVADLVTLDADGFTLNWSLVDAGAGYPINYICLGGSDLSVKVGTFDTSGSTGNQSITGAGFLPKAVLFGANTIPGNDGSVSTTRANIGFGAATSSAARSCVASRAEGAPSATTGVLSTAKCWTWAYTTLYSDMDFVSNDSDGFTVNITTATGGDAFRIGYIALGGTALFATSTFAQPGATGAFGVSGVGFQPSINLFWSGGKAASNALSNGGRFMFGHAVSSSDRGVMWGSALDGSSTFPAESRAVLATKAITLRHDDATTVLADADFTSQDANGFTVNWSTADATARVVAYLSIGASGSGFSGSSNWGPMLAGSLNRLVQG